MAALLQVAGPNGYDVLSEVVLRALSLSVLMLQLTCWPSAAAVSSQPELLSSPGPVVLQGWDPMTGHGVAVCSGFLERPSCLLCTYTSPD